VSGTSTAEATFAALLLGFAAFELRNHGGGRRLLAAALVPELPRLAGTRGRPATRALHDTTWPLALGLAGFRLPHGHRLQVAALAWAAHVYAHRALGYDARQS
jgi:hypothetical protein